MRLKLLRQNEVFNQMTYKFGCFNNGGEGVSKWLLLISTIKVYKHTPLAEGFKGLK